jgi:hypothetical protein
VLQVGRFRKPTRHRAREPRGWASDEVVILTRCVTGGLDSASRLSTTYR